ncbi:MAG: hypothetical protein PVH84_12760, partial [Candidatus Aminicenantes bacterium]
KISSFGLKRVSMKTFKILWIAVFLVGVINPSINALRDNDLAGIWTGTMEIPSFGTYEMVLVLEKSNGEYKGTVSDDMEYIAEGTKVENLKMDGNKLSCEFGLTDGSVVYLTLEAEGNRMTGEAERDGGVVSCMFIKED